MISPQNLAIAAAAVGLQGREGQHLPARDRVEHRIPGLHVPARLPAVDRRVVIDGHLTDCLVRRSRASWFAPSHATGQENPDQEDVLQAKRDAVVLMSVSVPRRGATRGCPVRSCWPRRRGSPVCRPLDLDSNAGPAHANGNMFGRWPQPGAGGAGGSREVERSGYGRRPISGPRLA